MKVRLVGFLGRSWEWSCWRASALVTVLLIYALGWVSPALAATSLTGSLWSGDAPDSSSYVSVEPSGVILAACGGSGAPTAPSAQAFARSGTNLWTVLGGSACDATADAQGNTYIETGDSAGNLTVKSFEPSGNVRWSTLLPGDAPGFANPVLAPNGDVYFATYEGNAAAPVVAVDQTTGVVRFTMTLNVAYALYAYPDGLILVSDSDVEYLGYDGTIQHAYAFSPMYETYAVAHNGTVYLSGPEGPTCDVNGAMTNRVAEVTPAGVAWTWVEPATHRCGIPGLAATPDGGVAVEDAAGTSGVTLTHLDANGVPRWTHSAAGSPSQLNRDYTAPDADVNGTIAFPTNFDYGCATGFQNTCTGFQVEFLTQAAGASALPTLQTTDPADTPVFASGDAGLAIGSDGAYLLSPEYGTSQTSVNAYAVAGLAEDYQTALEQAVLASSGDGSLGGTPGSGGATGGGSPGSGGSSGGTTVVCHRVHGGFGRRLLAGLRCAQDRPRAEMHHRRCRPRGAPFEGSQDRKGGQGNRGHRAAAGQTSTPRHPGLPGLSHEVQPTRAQGIPECAGGLPDPPRHQVCYRTPSTVTGARDGHVEERLEQLCTGA
jgi:uncharacterized membrane protein YgcG